MVLYTILHVTGGCLLAPLVQKKGGPSASSGDDPYAVLLLDRGGPSRSGNGAPLASEGIVLVKELYLHMPPVVRENELGKSA